MYKYRAQASFFDWPGLSSIAMQAMKGLIVKKISDDENVDEFWEDFVTYVKLKHAHGSTPEEILAPTKVELQYDIASWLEAGTPIGYSRFKVSVKMAEFALPDEAYSELRAAIKTWDLTLLGMTKGVTRIRSSAQVRNYGWLQ